MPIRTLYTGEENRLDLSVIGNLDLTLSQAVCEICTRLPPSLQLCVIDLSEMEHAFDSGIALLYMLHGRLKELGTAVVIQGGTADVQGRITNHNPQTRPVVVSGNAA